MGGREQFGGGSVGGSAVCAEVSRAGAVNFTRSDR